MMKEFNLSSGTSEAEVALMFLREHHVSSLKNYSITTIILDAPDEGQALTWFRSGSSLIHASQRCSSQVSADYVEEILISDSL